MYESYFGLIERPFSIAPDPQYLYMSARHKEAMAHLSYGLSQGGCFIVLTGEVGTGKTTLCRNLMTDLPDNVDLALILNANINETELLQTICDELKISYSIDNSQKQLLDLINQYLLSTFADNRHTVLIIDEAQLLSRDVLEQVRLLTNLETTKHKLLQIILIGQPELSDMLTRNDLRQLAQRVTARYHLGELKRSEIEEYVNFRLGVAGCKQPLFSNQALGKLHQLTDGIPRKINVLADHALLSAYAQKLRLVDSNNIKESAKEVFFSSKPKAVERKSIKKWWWLLGLGLILLNIAFWWYFVAGNKADDESANIQTDPAAFSETVTDSAPELLPPPSVEQVEVVDSIEESTELLNYPQAEIAPVTEGEEVVSEPVYEVEPLPEQLTAQELEGTGSVIVSQEYLDVEEAELAALQSAVESPAPVLVPEINRALIERTEFGRILETSADLTGRVTAFRGLVQLWGVELPNQIFNSLCDELQTKGLQCIFFADWQQLLRFNRPAVLVLSHNNQRHRVIVEVLDGNAAEVRVGDNIYRISADELRSRWQGNDAVLVWRPSEAGSTFFQQGDSDVSMPIIRSYLNRTLTPAQLPLLESVNSALFDAALSQKVVSLQRGFDLLADGKVGNETYLLMHELVRPDSTPVLKRRHP